MTSIYYEHVSARAHPCHKCLKVIKKGEMEYRAATIGSRSSVGFHKVCLRIVYKKALHEMTKEYREPLK